jgi:hypothetical protein
VTNVSSNQQSFQVNGSKRRRVSVEDPKPLPFVDVASLTMTSKPRLDVTRHTPVTIDDGDPLNLVSQYSRPEANDAFRNPVDPLSPKKPRSKSRREHDLWSSAPSEGGSTLYGSEPSIHISNRKSEDSFQIPRGKVTDLTKEFEARSESHSGAGGIEKSSSKGDFLGLKRRSEPRASKMKPKVF